MRSRRGMIKSDQLLLTFYQHRQFNSAWLSHAGPQSIVQVMIRAIQQSRFDGLDPEFYHLNEVTSVSSAIESRTNQQDYASRVASLDLLLSNAFLKFGRHLQRGKTAPSMKDSDRLVEAAMDKRLLRTLNSALSSGRIFSELEGLKSNNQNSQGLRQALGKYLRIKAKGGWPLIPAGNKLKQGDRDTRIILIKKRLLQTGDLNNKAYTLATAENVSPVFDAALASAIRHFQGRHGLRQSGRLNDKTYLALNLPVEKRLLQIQINMDLRRWLPHNLERRHILVNIPAMELKAVLNNETTLKMRVIVGKPDNQTPSFSDTIPYLVINPYWYIPPDFVEHEILPAMRKNPDYLANHSIRLFEKMSADKKEVLAETIDWQSLTPDKISFYFRQDPGWNNSLGAIKFVVPNRQHIYLHDTPSKSLFQRSFRALSHGCVRVESPAALAAFMLQETRNWTKPKIHHLMNSGNVRKVNISKPVPLHITYWTVDLDQENRLQFLPDVYHLEPELAATFTTMD